MKPRYLMATTSLIAALAGATLVQAGPLGIVSGGAGAIGSLGGSLSGFGSNSMLGASGVVGAMGQGAITPPNLAIDRAPLGRAEDALQSVSKRARNRIEGARDAATERAASTAGEATGAAAVAGEATGAAAGAGEVTGAAAGAGNVQGSGEVAATKSVNSNVTRRPLRNLEANGSAQGEASASARGETPPASASAEAGGSAQAQTQVKR